MDEQTDQSLRKRIIELEQQLAELRDERRVHFAGLAMQGLCAHDFGPPNWSSIAKNAAHLADLLIAELQGGEKDE